MAILFLLLAILCLVVLGADPKWIDSNYIWWRRYGRKMQALDTIAKPTRQPGRYNVAWFQASKPGRYHLFCAEYCGTQHSGMIGWVHVMEPAQFQAWLSGGAAVSTES